MKDPIFYWNNFINPGLKYSRENKQLIEANCLNKKAHFYLSSFP